ncbi:MAG TPA: aminotransferase class III-fold pyridoxal phosphate-dependent enzyme [Polyangium sp.]|nr:aminotransferase class III-fold pyridoxal phosphate-dependent enzyme [Polyangium sp.]
MTNQAVLNGRQVQISEKLSAILTDLSGLDLQRIGLHSTFLRAGLDSLFLIQLSAAIKQQLHVTISFREMIEQIETFAALVAHIDRHAPPNVLAPKPAPAAETHAPVEHVKPTPASTNGASLNGAALVPAMPFPQAIAPRGSRPGLEAIINQQLQLMSMQLQMLQGQRINAELPTSSPTLAAAEEPRKAPPPPAVKEAKDVGVESLPAKPFGAIARINIEKTDELTPAQQKWLADFMVAYNARTAKSKAFSAEHRAHMADPRVVTGFKRKLKELVYPIVAEHTAGCHIWDLDGNEYVDALNGFGSNFFGYANPKITQAVVDQLWKGTEIGPQCPLTGEVAKMICEFTGMERVGFCNTGSEATLAAMRMARTVTGRRLIATFTDSYHGVFDEVLVRGTKSGRPVPAVPGVMPSSVENILVLDYDRPESLEILRQRAHELAAVMVEPIQTRRPELRPHAFLKEVRRITEESGTALIFDEVVTGFRMHPGGAQAYFGIKADLASYGKVIGGGMSVGVVAGRPRFMDALDGGPWQFGDDSVPEVAVTYFAGTFVRHPAAMAACKAALEILREGGQALHDRVNGLTARIVDELNAFFARVGAPLTVVSFASVFRVNYTEPLPYGDLLFYLLRHEGIHIYDGFPCYMTLAHNDDDADKIIAAFKKSVRTLQQVGFMPPSNWEPLSHVQKQYMVAETTEEKAFVHEGSVFALRGPLNVTALDRACKALVLRHDALRIVVEKCENDWIQCVQASPDVRIEVVDAQGWSQDELLNQIQTRWIRLFDLAHELPVRFHLFRHGPENHTLFLLFHHVAIDGWSMAIIHEDLRRLYEAEGNGTSAMLPALPWSFMDHVRWERDMLQGPEGEQLWQYWQGKLSGELPLLNLPTDHPRPDQFTHRGQRHTFDIGSELSRGIQDACQREKVTPYVFALAAFQLLLHRWSGQKDLLIGTMALNRMRPEHRQLVGSLVDVSVLRSTLSGDETFEAYLHQVRDAVLGMLSHPGYPYLLLDKHLRPERIAGQPPIVQVVFNWEDGLERSTGSATPPASVTWEPIKVSVVGSWEDYFLVYVEGHGDHYHVTVTYNSDLFVEPTIARLMQDYLTLLKAAIENPRGSILNLSATLVPPHVA